MKAVNQMSDLPKQARRVKKAEVHGPRQCPRCDSTLTAMGTRVPAEKIVLEPDSLLYQTITEELGYQQAPVVFVEIDGVTYHWSGHRMDLITRLAKLVKSTGQNRQ